MCYKNVIKIIIKHMYTTYGKAGFLFYTSFLFLITSILSYLYNSIYSSLFNLLLFLSSVTHWNKPEIVILKRIDMFIVKMVGIFYFINSLYKNEFDREFLSSLVLSIIIFYIIEHFLDFYNNNQWVIFHMAIHIYGSFFFILFLFI